MYKFPLLYSQQRKEMVADAGNRQDHEKAPFALRQAEQSLSGVARYPAHSLPDSDGGCGDQHMDAKYQVEGYPFYPYDS